jgi:uncharacterized protein with von Willebrand factor type A (vWA) domain
MTPNAEPTGSGQLVQNILYFARALRDAGLPVGPGSVIDALAAVEAAGIGDRADFYAVLHAVLVKKHEHSIIFDQAFRIFWKRKGFLEKLIAMMSPAAKSKQEQMKPEAGASRVAEALFKNPKDEEKPAPSLDLDARFTVSSVEILQRKDFAQMTAAEIALAKEAIARLVLTDDATRTRRHAADIHGRRIDPRRSFRRSLKAGGAAIELAFRAPVTRPPPVVAICDISGSMSEYTRIFLHFLHALAERRRVATFLFGTRLTNVTRSLRARDPDDALARCSDQVQDWSGGTRIADSLRLFNRDWSRRVLGQGAIVILFTDGLERGDASPALAAQMERLHKSSRRLIWVNPLLRYDAFQARALGIRAMLPHVDEFRAIHNLASMADLARALSRGADAASDPKAWLARAA